MSRFEDAVNNRKNAASIERAAEGAEAANALREAALFATKVEREFKDFATYVGGHSQPERVKLWGHKWHRPSMSPPGFSLGIGNKPYGGSEGFLVTPAGRLWHVSTGVSGGSGGYVDFTAENVVNEELLVPRGRIFSQGGSPYVAFGYDYEPQSLTDYLAEYAIAILGRS